MPTCDECAKGIPHTRRACGDLANLKFCSFCAANKVHFDCPNDEKLFGTPTYGSEKPRNLLPNCADCQAGRPHSVAACQDALHPRATSYIFSEEQPVIEGRGVITRIDSYTLSVDGQYIGSATGITDEQERRIRALTREQRARLLEILHAEKDETVDSPVTVGIDPATAAAAASANNVAVVYQCECDAAFWTEGRLQLHQEVQEHGRWNPHNRSRINTQTQPGRDMFTVETEAIYGVQGGRIVRTD